MHGECKIFLHCPLSFVVSDISLSTCLCLTSKIILHLNKYSKNTKDIKFFRVNEDGLEGGIPITEVRKKISFHNEEREIIICRFKA